MLNSAQETSKLWHAPNLGNLELLHANYKTQSFPKHTHERYAMGVIEKGALGSFYRGEYEVATAGDINLCIPGEPHTGESATAEGWVYRMFYFDTAFLKSMVSELAAHAREIPFFESGVIKDAALAKELRALHLQVEAGASILAQESYLFEVLAKLVQRHADDRFAPINASHEQAAVLKVKHYLEAFYAEDVSLEDLAKLTDLSRYHLLRSFQKAVGVPPHAYLRQVRVRRAKVLLAEGQSISEVALATGFSDQSHLNRWFKRLWGFTPGQYRNSVQDS